MKKTDKNYISRAARAKANSIQHPPCACGNKRAAWRGPRTGLRQYLCDACWKNESHTGTDFDEFGSK